MKFLKESKLGMTLVEMVISLLVLSILMTSTMGMIVSSNSIFISTSKAALDRQIGNSFYDVMESVLKYSTELYITDSRPTESSVLNKYKKYIYLSDVQYMDETNDLTKANTANGHVIYEKNGEILNLYDSGFYKGRTIQYTITPVGTNGTNLRITISVIRDKEIVYTRSATIKCINLSLDKTKLSSNYSVQHNQYICFNSTFDPGDESNAWTLEYRVSKYINDYNVILQEYYDTINPIYENYKDSITGDSVVRNSSGEMPYSVFSTLKKNFNTAIFGTNTDPTSVSLYEDLYKANTSIVVPTGQNNLRLQYQKKIYDLLKFSPTNAFSSFAASDNWDNPYYGVVATKEELYLGFLLKYYDGKNGGTKDNKIEKCEYPGLPDYYYDGTILQSNAENIITLGYFYDNTNDTYNSTLFDNNADEATVRWYVSTKSIKNDGVRWNASANWSVSNEKSAYHPDHGTQTYKTFTILDKTYYYGYEYTNATFDDTSLAGPDNGDAFYTVHSNRYYKIDSSATGVKNIDLAATGVSSLAGYTNGSDFGTGVLQTKLSATELTSSNASITGVVNNAITYKDGGSIDVTYTKLGFIKDIKILPPGEKTIYHKTIGITPKSDLPEGWYYISYADSYDSSNINYAYFYLKAYNKVEVESTDVEAGDNNKVVSNVAVFGSNNYSYGDKYAIYLTISRDGESAFDARDRVYNLSYQQAKISKGTGGDTVMASGSSKVQFHNIKLHQYIDWQLYGTDYNSWFLKKTEKTTGIINSIIYNTYSLVDLITGAAKAGDITLVGPDNAQDVLGAMGSTDITVGAGRHMHSYNAAITVYNSSNSTWYYIPTTTTKLSQMKSKLSFVSSTDAPTFIDVEFATSTYHTSSDRQYENSSAIRADIKNRKLSTSGLWGAVDTTSDTVWTSLPASSEGQNRVTLSMPGVTLDQPFTTKAKQYTGTTSASTSILLAAFISNDYKSDKIDIKISVNGTEIENGNTVQWNSGTNTVKIDVYEIKSRNILTNKITSETKIDAYSGYTITVNCTSAS